MIVTYSLAALANLFIPRLAAEASITHYHPWHFVIQFIQATKALFADQDARFSLLGTGIFGAVAPHYGFFFFLGTDCFGDQ